MRKLKDFAEWLYGGFDDSYTWLIWLCIVASFIELNDTPRWLIVAMVEAITIAMRVWTRDVVTEKRKRKERDRAA